MESSISQSNISIGFNTLPKPTKRILDVNDPFSDGRVKLSVNLFSIKIKEEYAKKVYLFGVDAKEVYPKTNENFPIALIKAVKRKKEFNEELHKYLKWSYSSGNLLFAEIKENTPDKFKIFLKISNSTGAITILDPETEKDVDKSDDPNDPCKYQMFTFKKLKTITEYSKEEIEEYGFSQIMKNYVNVIFGKILAKIGYQKDCTTRKMLYYKAEDAQKAELNERKRDAMSELYFFNALKAVSDIYDGNKVYLKILPKKILRSDLTYDDYYFYLKDYYRDYSVEKIEEMFTKNVIQQGRGLKKYNFKAEKIEDVIFDDPFTIMFENKDGKKQSVGDYIVQNYGKYNINLTKERQPIAVRYIDKGGKISHEKCQKLYIPMACLLIIGNITQSRVNVKNLIQTPNQKLNIIMSVRKEIQHQYNRDNRDNMTKDGIENCIDCELAPLELWGKVITPPMIEFSKVEGEKMKVTKKGAFEVADTKPTKTVALGDIHLFTVGLNVNIAESMYRNLQKAGETMGIKVDEPKVQEITQIFNSDSAENDLYEYFKKEIDKNAKDTILLFFMNNKYKNEYRFIKNALNLSELKVISQVVLYNPKKMDNSSNLSLYTNVLAQIFGKKSETLYSIDFSFASDTIVMAYSAMKYKEDQIITSICCSVEKNKTEYIFHSTIHEKGAENISPVISKLVSKCIEGIWKYQKNKINTIVIFRDGVNDKMIPAIRSLELPNVINGIKKGIEKMKKYHDENEEKNKKYEQKKAFMENAKLCFIIVNKNNEIKMFKKGNKNDDLESALNNQDIVNVPLGTAVDTDVVSPDFYDFMINSAYSERGTSNMTKYTVIYDESSITASVLYRLSYYLTYTCYNTTKSIKMPAPLYFVTRRNTFTRENLTKEINSKLKLFNISL